MTTKPYLKALLHTSAILALTTGVAFAQTPTTETESDQEEQSQESSDEIVVTGSRLRRDNFSSPVSMDVLDVEDAKIEGIADVSGLLQTATAAFGSSQVTNAFSTAFVAQGGVGAETVSLRGLGAGRTLTLVNGRRAGPSGTRGSISAFDLGTIPLVGLERVDILKDGASSIYGSDAIAGVVNYITDKSDGAEVDLYTEIPEESGGEVFRGSASYGKTFDKGRFRVTGDYYKAEELAREDRSYLDCNENYSYTDASLTTRADVIDPRTGQPQCGGTIWGHVWVYQSGGPADNIAQNPRNLIFQFDYPGDNLGSFIPSIPTSLDGTGIVTPPGWFQVEYDQTHIDGLPAWAGVTINNNATNSVTNLYPDMQRRDSVTPEVERYTLMGDVEYEISDNVTAYAEGLFNRRSNYVNAHKQYWTYQYGNNAVFAPGDPVIPNSLYPEWGGTNTWFSPTPVVEHGDEEVTVEYFRLVGGLKGSFGEGGPFPGWDWDVNIQHSDSYGEYWEQHVRADSTQDYNFAGSSSCVGTTTAGRTATLDNGEVVTVAGVPCADPRWFDPNFLAGDLNEAERAALLDDDFGYTDFTQTSLEGYVTGDVIELPGGMISAALGAFYQRDEIYDRPSDTTLTGNEFFGSSAGITTGVQSTSALYGEVAIPIVKDQPLFESLEVIASGRFSEITSKNEDGRSITVDGFNYRVTADWQVIPEFRLRGSIGTSFRAPALFEQFLADESSASRQSVVDPCIGWGTAEANGDITPITAANCAADGIPEDYVGAPISASILTGGGFGDLIPETSENFTVGFVLSPDLDAADISFAVDYFDITVKDEISTLSGAQIVSGCYNSESFATEPLCDLVDRGFEVGDPTAPLRIANIRAGFVNVNDQTNKGLDFTLRAAKETKWGDLNFYGQASHQIEDEIQLLAASDVQFLNGGIGEPEWTGVANITFVPKENLLLRWGIDYVGEQNALRDRFSSREESDLPEGGGAFTVNQDGQTVFWKTDLEAVFYHSVSAQYDFGSGWTVRAGINNIFDEHPSFTSASSTFGNTSASATQYDLRGRRGFLNISKKFN